jgi:7,8-dihydropterin-6-yl-methyl-4-(beta-D-ribofuranosyl)aminobenzene 5'-phosphate synthase
MRRYKSILITISLLAIFTIRFTAVAQPNTAATTIKLTNLYDAFGAEKAGLKQDFGFSCLIEYKGKTILFDAGTNTEIFQQHLKTLKIDPKTIDIVILSHGHYDHMGGLDYLLSMNPSVKIYLPNDFFSLGAPVKFPFREADPAVAKTLSKEEQYFRGEKVVEGMVTVPTGRFWKGDVTYLTKAEEVLPGLTIIPTTSQLMGTFIKYPPHEKNPQFIGLPELSASFSTPNGQVIIAGCSHSTIETIIQETKKIRKENIYLVTGGFHLIPYERAYIEGLAKRMRMDYAVAHVAPAHCTGHMGFSIFKQVFGDKYKFFGLGETLRL